jgi:hypothetical protein
MQPLRRWLPFTEPQVQNWVTPVQIPCERSEIR